jgi:hypothetical protein
MYSFEVVVARVDGSETSTSLLLDGCVAAGFTGRDQASVHTHIEELKKLGVTTPYRIPALYWISVHRLNRYAEIEVVGEKTSPEVEFFMAADRAGTRYVTIASDHTDRELETVSVSKSKQVCDKVVGDIFWVVDDVSDHWDEIEITSRVYDQTTWVEYQAGTLKDILHYSDLLTLVKKDNPEKSSPGLLSGTLPIIGSETVFATACEIRMNDLVLKRSISKTYSIIGLPDRS